jgi:TatD DNase family protein
MALVDSHCHLQDTKFDEDRDEVIERTLEACDWVVVIGDDLPTSEAAVDLIRPGIFATVGVHPYYAGGVDAATIERLRALTARPGVVGIGEIGLDYYKYNETPRDTQHRGFVAQLELAAALDLPVVIHNREADADVANVLERHAPNLPGGILHCFSGDEALVRRAEEWGFYISFAGNVTYPKAEDLRRAAAAVRADRLLVETDAPYLAPQPVRGKRCEPAHVQHTAARLAEVRGVPIDQLCAETAANAARLFRIKNQ